MSEFEIASLLILPFQQVKPEWETDHLIPGGKGVMFFVKKRR